MAVESKHKKPGPRKRRQTDRSLKVERAKSDDLMTVEKEKAEHETDEAISANRKKADRSRAKDRDHFNKKEGFFSGDAHDSKQEKKMLKERLAADSELEKERHNIDVFLDHERVAKRFAENDFIQGERDETDRNLARERVQNDLDMQRMTANFREEAKAHQMTRAEVTTRDEFLAIVSHDLRNPLGAISMAVELMTKSQIYAADTEIVKWVDMISRSSHEALQLIGDLLDMERIAVGKFSLHFEILDFTEIVDHTMHTFRLQAAAKNLLLHAPPDCQKILGKGDRVRVSQVLANLLNNAIKFTPSGGEVRVALGVDGSVVHISVADNGPGIDPLKHESVFNRFSQLGKSDRRGLGLGLYISRLLVEALEGRIWVESAVGKGSVFHVVFPTA